MSFANQPRIRVPNNQLKPVAFDLVLSGAGPIGLVSLLAAKALGATPIIITDLFQSRLDFAKTLHKDVQTVLVERGQTAEEVAGKIKEAAGGAELKFALECTGVESSIRTCIFVSLPGFNERVMKQAC